LQYFVDNAKPKGLRVHAWVTVNVITPKTIDQLPANHLYYTNPHWLTNHADGTVVKFSQFEGAFLDPGLDEVQDYLVNVFSDIVQNYDIDGLHLDYIRYPQTDYGYHPKSIDRFYLLKDYMQINDFAEWKELQINRLVQKIGQSIKRIKSNIIYSAAVVPGINAARNNYSQNWYKWLDDDIIDNVYVMHYTTSNQTFESVLNGIPNYYRPKIVVGMRAWSDDRSYKIQGIYDKIALVPDNFKGLCFFSYGGIIERKYEPAIKRK
jgi:uncharacterized lipoprotein YddW (UPF0748 family)